MIYTLSVDSFNNTFAVKEDGTKLTHWSGKRFKLFPFIANNNIKKVVISIKIQFSLVSEQYRLLCNYRFQQESFLLICSLYDLDSQVV